MLWTVGVLAFLSAIGGLLQFTPLWHPLTDLARPGRAHRPPTRATPRRRSPRCCAVGARRSPASGSPTRPTSTKTLKVPKPVTLFEKKFYWDELYDAVFYKPADLISRGLGRFFEQPRDRRLDRRGARSASGSAPVSSPASRTASSAPTSSRSRAGSPSSPSSSSHDDRGDESDWLTTILIFLPMAGAGAS